MSYDSLLLQRKRRRFWDYTNDLSTIIYVGAIMIYHIMNFPYANSLFLKITSHPTLEIVPRPNHTSLQQSHRRRRRRRNRLLTLRNTHRVFKSPTSDITSFLWIASRMECYYRFWNQVTSSIGFIYRTIRTCSEIIPRSSCNAASTTRGIVFEILVVWIKNGVCGYVWKVIICHVETCRVDAERML